MSARTFFTRDFCLLFVANFVVVAVYFLLMTTMAAYALGAYDGCTHSQAGLAASIFLIGGVIGRVVCGRYAEYVGLLKLTTISLAVTLACCIIYMFSGFSLGFLMVLRFIHGVAFGVANTTLPAIVAKTLPPERLGEGTGYFMLSNSLALGIGPMVGLFVTAGLNYQVVFIICSVAAAVALVCLVLAHVEGDEGTRIKPGKFTVSSFLDPKAARFSIFMFLVALGYASVNTYLNSYAADMGLGMFSPFTFLMYSVALLISRPLTGKLMDRKGENAVLYLSIVCHVLMFVLIAFASNGAMLICVGILMALGFGTCMSVGQAVCVKLLGQERSTIAVGTFFFLCDAGCGIAPYFWGLLITAAGYVPMYLGCACVGALALAYYHFEHGRNARK